MTAVVLFVHEVSWTMASEKHQELPHEQDHEVVHGRKSQVPAENKLPNRCLNVILIDVL